MGRLQVEVQGARIGREGRERGRRRVCGRGSGRPIGSLGGSREQATEDLFCRSDRFKCGVHSTLSKPRQRTGMRLSILLRLQHFRLRPCWNHQRSVRRTKEDEWHFTLAKSKILPLAMLRSISLKTNHRMPKKGVRLADCAFRRFSELNLAKAVSFIDEG